MRGGNRHLVLVKVEHHEQECREVATVVTISTNFQCAARLDEELSRDACYGRTAKYYIRPRDEALEFIAKVNSAPRTRAWQRYTSVGTLI